MIDTYNYLKLDLLYLLFIFSISQIFQKDDYNKIFVIYLHISSHYIIYPYAILICFLILYLHFRIVLYAKLKK